MFGIKRSKKEQEMPSPDFKDNWQADQFKKNIELGVKALSVHKALTVFKDDRSFELCLRIKDQFITEYVKRLAKEIEITETGVHYMVRINPH